MLLVSGGAETPALALRAATLAPAVVSWVVAHRTGQAALGLVAGLAAAVLFRLG